jgi:hypothetical protein
MGFDGRKSVAQVATLELIFLRRVFRGRFHRRSGVRCCGSRRSQSCRRVARRPAVALG